MTKKIKISASIFLIVAGLLASAGVPASEETPPIPAEQKAEIVTDFLDVAFSETLWNQDTGKNFKIFIGAFLREYKELTSPPADENDPRYKLPWTSKYAYRTSGFPKAHVINKWTREITIGIDMPPSVTDDHRDRLGRPVRQPYDDIQKQVEKLIPQIEHATGLKVRFIPPESPEEKTENYARIRIARSSGFYGQFFKHWKGKPTDIEMGMVPPPYHYQMWGAIPFTPGLRVQVEGYLLPNQDNSIGMAVCDVVPKVGEDMLRSLISECLLRSLGLPDKSEASDNDLLGNWNSAFELSDEIGSDKGPEELKHYSIAENKGPGMVPEFPSARIDKSRLYDDFSEYDLKMLKMLYCDSIHPGMDKYEVLSIFAKDDSCFKK